MRTHPGSARNVCVLHIKPFCLLVDIKHTQVSALILHPREIQALWSQSFDTGSYVVPVKPQFVTVVYKNAMPLLCWPRKGQHTYSIMLDSVNLK